MRMLGRALSAVLAAASLVASASAPLRIGPDGTLEPVEVLAQVPEQLSGTMPEVVVAATVPERLRGMMPEVLVVADGPPLMLEEVVVVARAPDDVQAQTMHVAARNVGAGPEEAKRR
ncbi:MAG: hypothetical protein JSU73_11085 [candidate division WOR-3 bacterium]|nr:MAG: hypothetical protein JSU73_11085 [candidate division WOR-3 bacterium]